jgi:cytochrome c peroxidase
MSMSTRRASRLALFGALATLIGVATQVLTAGATVPRRPVASELVRLRATYRRPREVPHSDGNAPTAARVALGKALFFDKRVSGTGDVACASCHMPDRGWEDGRQKAIGTRDQHLGRHTPTVLNTAYAAALFWDGRAGSLEEQAVGPIQASGEMDMRLDSLSARLGRVPGYRRMFAAAYPGKAIDGKLVGSAIASFERTVISARAPFDRWVDGDEGAISASAKRGFVIFNTTAGCAQCHGGWRFTDDSFHDIGVAGSDSGRARILPGIESMQFAFKTPTLRDLTRRAPYMHDGSEPTLEDVVDLYDKGGRVQRPSLAAEVKPLGLSAREKHDLVAFLRTLDGPSPAVQAPRLPR